MIDPVLPGPLCLSGLAICASFYRSAGAGSGLVPGGGPGGAFKDGSQQDHHHLQFPLKARVSLEDGTPWAVQSLGAVGVS